MRRGTLRPSSAARPAGQDDGMASPVTWRMQDSTHYERTQAILRKYDPAYAKAQAKEREAARREGAQTVGVPATPGATPVRMPSPSTPLPCYTVSHWQPPVWLLAAPGAARVLHGLVALRYVPFERSLMAASHVAVMFIAVGQTRLSASDDPDAAHTVLIHAVL